MGGYIKSLNLIPRILPESQLSKSLVATQYLATGLEYGTHHLFPIDNSSMKMKHGCRWFLQCALVFPGARGNRNQLEPGESNEQS